MSSLQTLTHVSEEISPIILVSLTKVDTLILQLGHILQSVKTWKQAYQLRIMVFVEYENEVEEESARVKSLLEKLRIDARVVVFWLASGELNTYELIINGTSHDMDWEIIVHEALRDEEWWDDLQSLRGGFGHRTRSEDQSHMTQIMNSTYGRPGVYNPHDEIKTDRNRPDLGGMGEMPRRPPISVLSKLGVNVGMHTSHLIHDAIQEPGAEDDSQGDYDNSTDADDMSDFEDMGSLGPASYEPSRRPLLSNLHPVEEHQPQRQSPDKAKRRRRRRSKGSEGKSQGHYGTMSTSQTLLNTEASIQEEQSQPEESNIPKVVEYGASPRSFELQHADTAPPEPFPSFSPLNIPPSAPRRARSMSPARPPRSRSGSQTEGGGGRPIMSRQSSAMKFSSRPVPETTVTMDGEDSRMTFARTESDAPQSRPPTSRNSSFGHGRFSSRPVPETRLKDDENGRTISFAQEPTYHPPSAPHSASQSASHSRHHSRQSSHGTQGDLSLSMPELLKSYKFDQQFREEEDAGAGSSYATGSVPLSFNDLPSRAQHLILNELMRNNSTETAVLMSTLPVPSEGTSQDDVDTIRYLSDVEVLCNELPPMLMVLSNNMTVTVSL